jgi:hypothetical protein
VKGRDIGIDGKIILKCILRKYFRKVPGFKWLSVGSIGGVL